MNVLIVASHPRTNSFTFAVADRFAQGLQDAGHRAELLDLYSIGFDPALREADEPVFSSTRKMYSPEVEAEIARMMKHEALAYVFPIWWYNMPAMLKGYIDRVWNDGIAYGSGKLHHERVLWLGLAGASREHFEKRHYDDMLKRQLNVGMASYAGIPVSKVEILYNTLDARPGLHERLLAQAYDLGFRYREMKGDVFE
ncbi:NAD(P)H oxidoreductase [Paenibacillus sedimenti]|uniref:NAD(P)H oxidoreductase n=1 Tax=Paenibacillus sedimenti TaxID=2770274 RepID=A0A926KL76_9BACL|nr:NAD(P)H oxidoreductase [Paenibacillus sedimenti]MBD0378831.1 NAD(P)H oxidoreductase [Paenibacillus sedimenti]